jgi:hypothetical protein
VTLPFAEPLGRARDWLVSDRARLFLRRATPWLVFAIALWIRLDMVEERPPSRFVVQDMAFYDASARRLMAGTQTVWDSFTPVGYPAFLAVAYRFVSQDSIGTIQAVIGALGCVVAASLTSRLVRGVVAPLGVGLFLAFYLPLVLYTGLLMTETLFATAILGSVWLLVRGAGVRGSAWAAGAGVIFGAAAVVRPNLLLAVPLLGLLAIALRRRREIRRALAIAAATAILPIAIGSIHQSRLAERPVLLSTNGGINLFLGHCQCRAVRFPPGNKIVEVAGRHNRTRYDEVALFDGPAYDDGQFYRRTLELIVADPARLIRDASNVSDGLGFGPSDKEAEFWPGWMGHNDSIRWFSDALIWFGLLPASVYGVVLAFRRRFLAGSRGALRGVLWSLIASALLTNYLFLGDPRIRVSFDPLIAVIGAEAWAAVAIGLFDRLRRSRIADSPR